MRELVRLSVICQRLTVSRLRLNWTRGHLYTTFWTEHIEQMIHRKNRLLWCHTMKRNSKTKCRILVSTDEAFEMVSYRRQCLRRPRSPVETSFMPQYLVKGCKGQINKIMVWGDMVVRHACASYCHWNTQWRRLPATAFQYFTSDMRSQPFVTPRQCYPPQTTKLRPRWSFFTKMEQ